mgnify:FL=1
MPAPRKPRHTTEEALREATRREALAEVNAALAMGKARLTEDECAQLSRGGEVLEENENVASIHPIREAYSELCKASDTLRSLQSTTRGYMGVRSALDVIVGQLAPLYAPGGVMSEECRVLMANFERLPRPEALTQRQWAVAAIDRYWLAQLGRVASSRELACVALAGDDFPRLAVGKDRVSDVIKRMASVMASAKEDSEKKLVTAPEYGKPK